MTKPFIKYVGGKGQFVNAIASRMPPKFGSSTFRDYYEPFLGGGAIALNMLSQVRRKAYLSDITPELINTWQCVQRNPLKLFRSIADLKVPTCLKDYLAIRTEYNAGKCHDLKMGAKWIADMDDKERFAIAAMYIWLNKTCFNGVYRVDKKKNEFNVSWNKNKPKPKFPTKQHLSEISLIIRNAEITCQSFATALQGVQENDLVYVDPPYDDTFNDYSTDGFGVQGQVYLFNALQNIGSRGAYVFASNSDTPYVRSLYKGWEHIVLLRKGTVNSKVSDRGKVDELLLIKK